VVANNNDIMITIFQRSIFGAYFILTVCYINDLHTITDHLTLMFADDTFCLKSDFDISNLITRINSKVNKMAVWVRANKLAVNISKIKYIIFKTKGKIQKPDFPDYYIMKMNLMYKMTLTLFLNYSRAIP
jgi:hypothetical protein